VLSQTMKHALLCSSIVHGGGKRRVGNDEAARAAIPIRGRVAAGRGVADAGIYLSLTNPTVSVRVWMLTLQGLAVHFAER